MRLPLLNTDIGNDTGIVICNVDQLLRLILENMGFNQYIGISIEF
jgi:hypothetical protein